MHGAHELEAADVRGAFKRLFSSGEAGGNGEDAASLRAEVERLRAQNDSLKSAMRHCIDCEYRLDVVGRRAESGLTADGGEASQARAASVAD